MGDRVLENCPNRAAHTPAPSGYVAWFDWAAAMHYRGHQQRKCGGCGRYAVWVPASVVRSGGGGSCLYWGKGVRSESTGCVTTEAEEN